MAIATVFTKARTTDSASTAFTAKIPTVTMPSGSGIHDLSGGRSGGGSVPSYLQLVPYGKDTNNDTFNMRLWGWNSTSDATPLYSPQLLLDLSLVLGNIDYRPTAMYCWKKSRDSVQQYCRSLTFTTLQ